MLDTDTLICYGAYDLNAMGIDPKYFYCADFREHIYLSAQPGITLFTIRKNLNFKMPNKPIFIKEMEEIILPTFEKKGLFESLFAKKINIQKCLEKNET